MKRVTKVGDDVSWISGSKLSRVMRKRAVLTAMATAATAGPSI